jgi:membrane-bound lytic murein transglycosylase F
MKNKRIICIMLVFLFFPFPSFAGTSIREVLGIFQIIRETIGIGTALAAIFDKDEPVYVAPIVASSEEEFKEKKEKQVSTLINSIPDDQNPIKVKKNLPVDSSKYTTKYDELFRKESKRNFGPGFDYRWMKSQAIAESGLNPTIKSPVGACGLMQLMPGTFEEEKKKLGMLASAVREDPQSNIQTGVHYDFLLYRQWKSERPEFDRLALMFASYNAGLGNPLKSQKVCTEKKDIGCNLWSKVAFYAPQVRSWKCEESLGYTKRIFGLMGEKDR